MGEELGRGQIETADGPKGVVGWHPLPPPRRRKEEDGSLSKHTPPSSLPILRFRRPPTSPALLYIWLFPPPFISHVRKEGSKRRQVRVTRVGYCKLLSFLWRRWNTTQDKTERRPPYPPLFVLHIKAMCNIHQLQLCEQCHAYMTGLSEREGGGGRGGERGFQGLLFGPFPFFPFYALQWILLVQGNG